MIFYQKLVVGVSEDFLSHLNLPPSFEYGEEGCTIFHFFGLFYISQCIYKIFVKTNNLLNQSKMMVAFAIYTIYLDLSNGVTVQCAHDLLHIGKLLHTVSGIQDKAANLLLYFQCFHLELFQIPSNPYMRMEKYKQTHDFAYALMASLPQ